MTKTGPRTGAPVTAVPVSTRAFSTGPAGARLDVSRLPSTEANRWSRQGEPTIYLAGDPGVALAELGRHWEEQRGEVAIWSLHLALRAAADLRDPATRAILDVPDDPRWILDQDRCHALASRLRWGGTHDGMIVPSAAFLDDPSRWNAVVFADDGRPPVDDLIRVESAAMRLTPKGS
jgi:RES domain-containing protein